MDIELLEKLKIYTIQALVSDDDLMERLFLKGGNAIDLFHKFSQRGSIDLDFSITGTFDDSNLGDLENRICNLLTIRFKEEGYEIFDVSLKKRPKKNMDPVLDKFWGGYNIDFKILDIKTFQSLGKDISGLLQNFVGLM